RLPGAVRERDHAEPDEVVPTHAGGDELDRAARQPEVEHPQRVAPPPVEHEADRLAEHRGQGGHGRHTTARGRARQWSCPRPPPCSCPPPPGSCPPSPWSCPRLPPKSRPPWSWPPGSCPPESWPAAGGRAGRWPGSTTTNWPIIPRSSCASTWQWYMYGESGSV